VRLEAAIRPKIPRCGSETTPLTFGQVFKTLSCFTQNDVLPVHEPSKVEYTFDIPHAAVASLKRTFITRNRTLTELCDASGLETVYAGSRNSHLQACLYQKTEDIARLELILRLRHLRTCGIRNILDLDKLRMLNLDRYVSFGEVVERDKRAARELLHSDLAMRAFDCFGRMGLRHQFANSYGATRAALFYKFEPDERVRLLRSMKKRFIW
jgi:hypothetical protein